MEARGIDLGINVNWFRGEFNWDTSFNFGYNTNEVTDSRFEKNERAQDLVISSSPIAGIPIDYLYAYRWAGLDANGQSQIYNKDGEIITADKSNTVLEADDLRYMGRTTPPYIGGLTNSFSYKNFTLSVRMSYQMGHVFRRSSIQNYPEYAGTYTGRLGTQKDMALRWKESGDELHTNVPGIVQNGNQTNSVKRYENSDHLVISGSHIRLQQINLGYNFPAKMLVKTPVKSLNVTGSVRNLGIIWKKNKDGVDPMYRWANNFSNLPPTPSFFFSLNASF